MADSNRTSFQRKFEIEPIILINGIATGKENNAMSILELTEGPAAIRFADPNDYFAHYRVLSGGTLAEWGVAEYPFASMTMAANAVIQNPLRISLLMICPAQANGYSNYTTKESTLTNLKTQLDTHVLAGGYFVVATPGYTYNACLLTSLRDVSTTADKQVQFLYQWDFMQPLLTQEAANVVFNNLYNRFSNNLPTPNPVVNSSIDNNLNNPSPSPTTPSDAVSGTGP